jgi:tRNA pseudouridine(55) synthase
MDSNVVLCWKPKSITPLQQLEELKKQRNHKGKACYAGRLDPMAQGYMIYLFGEATKQCTKFMQLSKIYEFDIVCGISTDSLDCLGIIQSMNLNISDPIIDTMISHITLDKYKHYKQELPVCSAYRARHKLTGKIEPLWKWKQQQQLAYVDIPIVDIELLQLDVLNKYTMKLSEYATMVVKDIENVTNFSSDTVKTVCDQWNNYKSDDHLITIIKCKAQVSSGTYIRSLVNIIGKDHGIATHAYNITRTHIHLPET